MIRRNKKIRKEFLLISENFIAPTGNRTQGKRLEGVYVTTTPLVLAACIVFFKFKYSLSSHNTSYWYIQTLSTRHHSYLRSWTFEIFYCFQYIPRSTFSSTEGFCGNVLLPPWQCTNLLTNSRVPSRYSDSSGSTTTLNYSSC